MKTHEPKWIEVLDDTGWSVFFDANHPNNCRDEQCGGCDGCQLAMSNHRELKSREIKSCGQANGSDCIRPEGHDVSMRHTDGEVKW